MIELGQIRAGAGRGHREQPAAGRDHDRRLNRDTTLTRDDVKPAVASLTIGSGSAAVLLTRSRAEPDRQPAARRRCGRTPSSTTSAGACEDGAVGSGMQPLMETDSETLLREGIATGVDTFARCSSSTLGWTPVETSTRRSATRSGGASQADARGAWGWTADATSRPSPGWATRVRWPCR